MAGKQDIENPEAVEVFTDTGNPSPPDSPPKFRPVLDGKVPRIRTATDAKKLFGRLISQFTRGEVASEDARTLCYLLTGYIQVCAVADLQERIDQMEKKKAVKTIGAK